MKAKHNKYIIFIDTVYLDVILYHECNSKFLKQEVKIDKYVDYENGLLKIFSE